MQLKFALIGCGRIAHRHAENILKKGSLVAVCDIIPARAEEFAAKYGATAYHSIESLLKEETGLTIGVICTPNGLHASHSIKCLENGLHVLCEKPMSINSIDGKTMAETAIRTGKCLFVVKQNRFNPPVIALKELCTNNRLGNITSFQLNCFWNRPSKYYEDTWKGSKDLDGGTLFTQFSHFIDLLYWILGDVKEVKAISRNFSHPAIEIEDTGVVLIEMQSGAIGTLNYTVNSYEQNMEGSFTLFGEKGTVKIGGQYLNKVDYQLIEGFEIPILPTQAGPNDYGYYQGSMSNHDKVYDELVKALGNDEHTMPGAGEGLKTVEIIEKIYRSVQ